MSTKDPTSVFPIHILVWHNRYDELDKLLAKQENDLEKQDPRGRTPLHLAITMGYLESARVLLRHGANANAENKRTWNVLQEAVSTGDPELVQMVLQHRDYQRFSNRTVGVPELLQRLKEAPDFYVEMKWEFTSWVPLISRMCPSDTYKVYKSGANVRIDTTLLGFDNMNWQRGSRSFIFKGTSDSALVMEVDHDMHQVYTETMQVLPDAPDILLQPSEDAVAGRLTSPINTTYIDVDKISFERNKSGIWGWRSDKTEAVNGYTCKVFSASNVELVTKTRTEHLTEQEKQKTKKNNRNPLESFLGIAEQEEKAQAGAAANGEVTTMANNPCSITPEEYFNPEVDLGKKDIGRPIEQITKTQKFKANLWLCEDYPLSLQEQVLPIIDLMATSNAHFKKLKDFITLQLPAGFPVKIEIPLFHVLNARITFGNIYGSDEAVAGVQTIREADESATPMFCSVDDSVFEPPLSYSRRGMSGDVHHQRIMDEDELLQFAIQQSLMENGTENDQVTFWEALNKSRPSVELSSEENRQLQRALEESMRNSQSIATPTDTQPSPQYESYEDEQLRLVMELSRKEETDRERRAREEEEELEMIIQLSLKEK
ncbi:ankyrin repeat domain-containing protein 13D-like [Lineus longissimus]|uniref:ankyrin repeat domain-containing protein 13D-like n=1 Tax=Lineus longissimus TaxID=88925 RepID=UPI002B4D6367